MKTQSHTYSEVDALRAEVRALREAVVDLEIRLADVEISDDDPLWGVWPYNWAMNSWNALKNGAHCAQISASRKILKRNNRAQQKAVGERFEGLHLV